ncbi:hypothetical protein SEA_ET2BRUTUS_87 [Mycobacterium phage Et2Brutus]|nr:hypothetical protein SEA_ET2BRUTUS_87 [Mycobacterium phage Et2Brutus]
MTFDDLSCRYCKRYDRACGRGHTAATRGDWGRDEMGHHRDWTGRRITKEGKA